MKVWINDKMTPEIQNPNWITAREHFVRSDYKIELVTDTFILITDLDQYGRMSVTNDAINVIKELQTIVEGGIGRRQVAYRDSLGRYDFLLVQNGEFAGYGAGTPQQQAFFDNLVSA